MSKQKTGKLAKIIEKHPNAKFYIDNDSWYITDPTKMVKGELDEDEMTEKVIADSSDFEYDSEWYSHSSNYGQGISDALIFILNQRGFNLSASAV